MKQEDSLLWLQLLRWPGAGRRSLRLLLSRYSAQQIPDLAKADLQSLGLPGKACASHAAHFADPRQAEHDLTVLSEQDAHLLAISDPAYPALLREIPDPPLALFCAGDMRLLEKPMLAMVGGRKASREAINNSQSFARAFAAAGMAVCSGLALGVDAAAHQGALSANGATIAVIGTGIDGRYPRRNDALHQQIVEQGCVVTEFLPGTGVRPENFPQRNRIVSGLSLGVLVVEASIRSGSLITARLALEQGREVFALPGSLNNPLAKGCNALIKQGAALVESAEDVLAELVGWHSPSLPLMEPEQSTPAGEKAPGSELLGALGFDGVALDLLQIELALPVQQLQQQLNQLELEGLAEQRGGLWRRISSD